MSTASISYRSLKNSSSEAQSVAKKLDKYADSLYDDVVKKLNCYDGSWTSNLSAAKSNTNSKIEELRSEQRKYEDYAEELTDLKDECDRVDKAVKSKVSSLTASFKEAHGIKNNVVVNTISYYFTSISNSSAAGRWVNNKTDAFEAKANYHKQAIEDWYDYNGGKDHIKGVVVAALEIAIGVISIVGAVAAILAGGWTIALAAALVGGCIAVVNGVTNLVNERRAYNATQNNDPATGKRRSKMDTLQDTLRIETDSEFWHNVATGIDVVNITCAVISIYSGGKELLQKGYKWATGSMDDLSRIKWSDIFSKDFAKSLGGKFDDFKTSFQYGGWDFAKEFAKNLGKNMVNNFKYEYFKNFDLDTVKAHLKVGKTLLKDGITFAAVLEFVVGPSLTFGDYTTATFEGGKTSVEFGNISFGDFYEIFDDIGSKVIGSDLFKDGNLIDPSLLEQLNNPIDINISIPDNIVPKIPQISYA